MLSLHCIYRCTHNRNYVQYKRIVCIFLVFFPLLANAQKDGWICAVEWTEKNPNWVFVYENIKRQSDNAYRVYVKWEFPNDTKKSKAMEVWLISSSFDKMKKVESVGYDKNGEVVYTDTHSEENWKYIIPETYAEAVAETAKEILLNKKTNKQWN